MSDEVAAYVAARAGAARSVRQLQAGIEQEDGPVVDALRGTAGVLAEMLERPSPFTAMADRGVRACWCPPMDDSSDPEQHQVGCLHAEVIRVRRYWDVEFSRWEYRPRWEWGRSWSPLAIPAGCYRASFGVVHVRPGCRCPR